MIQPSLSSAKLKLLSWGFCTVAFIHHPSTPLRRCFFSHLSYSATRLRECIERCTRRTAILKNNSTAEKRREEEAFALKSIAHYCFVETKSNCAHWLTLKLKIDRLVGFILCYGGESHTKRYALDRICLDGVLKKKLRENEMSVLRLKSKQ